MKELALVCWIATVGFVAGLFADRQCFRSPAEERAINTANAAGRENFRLRERVAELSATLDAVRREQAKPTPPAGDRIPPVNPPLPTE